MFEFKFLMNNGVLILLLLASSLAAPIAFQNEPNFSFADAAQKAKIINKTPPPCSTNINSTARENISCIINSWRVATSGEGLSEKTIQLGSEDQKKKGCSPNINLFQQKIYEISKVDFDSNNILPGNVVNPNSFADGVVAAYIPENKRTPLNIMLFNGINEYFTISTPAAFTQKIRDILPKYVTYLNSQPIQIYIEQAKNIERVLRNLGLSTKTYEELLIAASTAKKVQSNQGKIVVVLIQKLFSAALDLSNNGTQEINNMVDAVFGPLYTADDFQQVVRTGYWGIGKVPRVITQTNFGRLFVLSMDDNADNQKLASDLAACSSVKAKEPCIDLAITAIQNTPTVRYYVGGVDEFAITERNPRIPYVYKEYVNWKNVFPELDNPKSINNLRPLSAKALDLLGQKFVQTENRFYSILKCGRIPDIVFKVSELTGQLTVKMKGKNENDFSKLLFTAYGPQVIDIGSTTLWQPFELQLSLKGKKPRGKFSFWKKTYNRKLKFSIIINGAERLAREIKSDKSSQQWEQITLNIEPKRGIAK